MALSTDPTAVSSGPTRRAPGDLGGFTADVLESQPGSHARLCAFVFDPALDSRVSAARQEQEAGGEAAAGGAEAACPLGGRGAGQGAPAALRREPLGDRVYEVLLGARLGGPQPPERCRCRKTADATGTSKEIGVSSRNQLRGGFVREFPKDRRILANVGRAPRQ